MAHSMWLERLEEDYRSAFSHFTSLAEQVGGVNEAGALTSTGAADGGVDYRWGAILYAERNCVSSCTAEMFGTWAVTAE